MSDLLAHTSRVTFEINDRCNLSHAHKKCPAHAVRNAEPTFLSVAIIHGVLDFMCDQGFDREIAWHNYNEPTADPRLLWLMDLAKAHVPETGQYILTNGLNLNQQMLDLLIAHGATRLWVSAYTEDVYARTQDLNAPGIDYKVRRFTKLDERLKIYDRGVAGDKHPCYEPLENLVIRADGRVGLCCVDWAQTVSYGDLHDTTLQTILEESSIRGDWERNTHGDRWHDICQRCRCVRGSRLAPPKWLAQAALAGAVGDGCLPGRLCLSRMERVQGGARTRGHHAQVA